MARYLLQFVPLVFAAALSVAQTTPDVSSRRASENAAAVSELRFDQFFGPIGDRGLEYSKTLRALNGKQVRIVGYVVQQGVPTRGLFMLSPIPLTTHEDEYGLCDELPPATVHVILPTSVDIAMPASGPVAVSGQLAIGPRLEADGRNSVVRLLLSSIEPAATSRSANVVPKHL